jgi:cyclohexanone monooxygenase
MTDKNVSTDFEVVIVGAGFAGLYMLHKMHEAGRTARVYEAGSGVGGTWYWNRYPGARVDIQSVEYSYSFSEELQQEWEWPEKYSAQPDILKYANHVADRFDLRKDIQFGTRVECAVFDEETNSWDVTTDQGDSVKAQFFVMATGCLSAANMPDIPGRDNFAGETYLTATWPKEGVDFTGKRVGLIGTGSSAVQSTPVVAEEAESLTVYQRTASYSLPSNNTPTDPEFVAGIKANYAGFREANRKMIAGTGAQYASMLNDPILTYSSEEQDRLLEAAWDKGGFTFASVFPDVGIDYDANEVAANFARKKIAEIVEDEDTAKMLMPDIVIGCKRMIIDSGYYETFNKPNVDLVDIKNHPIDEITENGIRIGDDHREFDVIIFATGFDAMTGAILNVDIRGRGGESIRDAWHAGPRTYLGLTTVGFPNMFVVTGPGSPSVLTNMIVSIEQHVEWIDECINYMDDNEFSTIDASLPAQDAWVDHVNKEAENTLRTDPNCNSWYLGANVEGKTRVFMPLAGFPAYKEKCDEVVAAGYEGFSLV